MEFELRDASGNIVNSSAALREQEKQATELDVANLANWTTRDSSLRDMLDHWQRYLGDPEGRLHPLYDILQVAERVYGYGKNKRKAVATKLAMNLGDLNTLAEKCNNNMLLNGRHPGMSPGSHRVADGDEVASCERVARQIITAHLSRISR